MNKLSSHRGKDDQLENSLYWDTNFRARSGPNNDVISKSDILFSKCIVGQSTLLLIFSRVFFFLFCGGKKKPMSTLDVCVLDD